MKVPPSARSDMTCQILSADGRRPAIVYAPTRRSADHLAGQLSLEGHAAAAYHAGLDARRRREVQEGFLEGRFEVIVATIAFGMGIDKPDVRTVIHTALPGSLEGFYQEIGRAGRDGKPSRAILMHSYADRFTHDFFYERDYPQPEVLDRIFEALTPEPQPKDEVQARSRLIGERFDIAMEKLWIHGGVVMDFEENLSRGTEEWRESYIAQRDHKLAQFERMLNYCDTPACRMLTLVKYFGDTADSDSPCGFCDVCNPESTILQRFRPAGPEEQARIAKIMNAVKKINGVSTGRLYSAVLADESQLSRRSFEELLNAMARSGLIELEDTFFEKDGERIDYRRVRLKTPSSEINPAQVQIPVEIDRAPAKPKKDAKRAAKAKTAVRRAKAATKKPKKEAAAAAAAARSGRQAATAEPDGKSASIESALKAWRSAEAKRKGVPAFRILTDRVLQAIAEKQPQSARELLEVPGISLKTVELYGQQIFRIVGG
ncbi:MAG: ATP-dependent DNA helicase RecQ [Bryobacteraceae bacterium]|nr:ATP-dependent DNA helicase RecQ [Bryobacteraceae bacterium]